MQAGDYAALPEMRRRRLSPLADHLGPFLAGGDPVFVALEDFLRDSDTVIKSLHRSGLH